MGREGEVELNFDTLEDADIAEVTNLIDHGLAIDSFDARGQTLLFAATKNNQPAMVGFLLAKGASPAGHLSMPHVDLEIAKNASNRTMRGAVVEVLSRAVQARNPPLIE